MDKKAGWMRVAGWIAIICVAVVVVYPLSVGPVLWLWAELGSPPWCLEYLRVVYTPLSWMLGKCPPFVLDWFVQYQLWWVGGR